MMNDDDDDDNSDDNSGNNGNVRNDIDEHDIGGDHGYC